MLKRFYIFEYIPTNSQVLKIAKNETAYVRIVQDDEDMYYYMLLHYFSTSFRIPTLLFSG